MIVGKDKVIVGMDIPMKRNGKKTVKVLDVSQTQFVVTSNPNSDVVHAYDYSGKFLEGIPGYDLDMSLL